MNKAILLLTVGSILILINSACSSIESTGNVLGKNESSVASIQFILPKKMPDQNKTETGFLKIRLESAYLRSLGQSIDFDYPGDSSIYFLNGAQPVYPSFVQYVNSGRPDEFHYLVSMTGLEKQEGLVLKTKFGSTAIDSLITPLNF